MRVVLDTNSLLVCIGKRSQYRPIFDALLEGSIQLLITNDILNEYVEKLEEKTNTAVAENTSNFLLRSPDVERVDIYFNWSIITTDVDDNKFVDCALNGRADYLVTDDKHYNLLKDTGFPLVNVIRTRDFLDLVAK
ncbi:putative toxin-antitoxin system toxin component, PIN family [Salmonirosea aquatica]|uniref:Putative toxin-antitoxin system toxin component, PIN family n=1 Tax=Salmonirosea aquatica TaxID=2654236 RepID=A0A7C9FCU8_9BACT|nr:putative toxin-antitoxin system toxin component, PIN family [Cytophagaceae bacterium SJW1-29]